jgi:putative transcriptional regulator
MDQEIGKGKLLIATPMLVDPNFRQTIVLLCEHGPDGSLGLVVNRPTDVEVSTLVHDFPDLANSGQVYSGGPVGQNAMLVLCRGNEPSEERGILEDVFLAKDLEMLKFPEYLGPEGKIRCYLGYAGWAPGQLEAEVNAGAWHLIPGDPELIFDANPATLWQEMMARIGGECAIYANMPPDPSVN